VPKKHAFLQADRRLRDEGQYRPAETLHPRNGNGTHRLERNGCVRLALFFLRLLAVLRIPDVRHALLEVFLAPLGVEPRRVEGGVPEDVGERHEVVL
jgi:hypothetical protein